MSPIDADLDVSNIDVADILLSHAGDVPSIAGGGPLGPRLAGSTFFGAVLTLLPGVLLP